MSKVDEYLQRIEALEQTILCNGDEGELPTFDQVGSLAVEVPRLRQAIQAVLRIQGTMTKNTDFSDGIEMALAKVREVIERELLAQREEK